MTFVLTLLHDTLVVALALTIAIPFGIFITYTFIVLIKGVLERIHRNGQS